jgi:hypothetical protein
MQRIDAKTCLAFASNLETHFGCTTSQVVADIVRMKLLLVATTPQSFPEYLPQNKCDKAIFASPQISVARRTIATKTPYNYCLDTIAKFAE